MPHQLSTTTPSSADQFAPSLVSTGPAQFIDPSIRRSAVATLPRSHTVKCIEARARSLQGWGGTHLVIQAGTGTGKSLGYLVPAALSGRPVIVATATKALQDQLATKDLPLLASASSTSRSRGRCSRDDPTTCAASGPPRSATRGDPAWCRKTHHSV